MFLSLEGLLRALWSAGIWPDAVELLWASDCDKNMPAVLLGVQVVSLFLDSSTWHDGTALSIEAQKCPPDALMRICKTQNVRIIITFYEMVEVHAVLQVYRDLNKAIDQNDESVC